MFDDAFPMTMEREAGMPENVPAVAVAFGLHPVVDSKRTAEAGHDVYKDVEFVRIAIPGDRNSLFFQPSQMSHRLRFPKAYQAYRDREKTPLEGMPIEQWAAIGRAQALNLRVLHIHTVEALAEVHDGLVDKIGSNGRELREKARAWLAEAKTGAASQKLAAEKQALQDQLAALQAQINAIQHNSDKAAMPAPAAPNPSPVDVTADIEQDVAAAARRPRRSAA